VINVERPRRWRWRWTAVLICKFPQDSYACKIMLTIIVLVTKKPFKKTTDRGLWINNKITKMNCHTKFSELPRRNIIIMTWSYFHFDACSENCYKHIAADNGTNYKIRFLEHSQSLPPRRDRFPHARAAGHVYNIILL